MLPVVHIGYARTGSTWLQQVVFSQMTGVANASENALWVELSWKLAVRDDDAYYGETLRAFVEEFTERNADSTCVFSQEMIADYWLGPPGTDERNLARMRELVPEAKIVLVVRRQQDVVPTLYGLYTRTGGFRPLSDVLVDDHDVEGWHLRPEYLAYDVVAARYAETYGRDRLHVLPYELSRTDPDRFTDELLEICGGTGFRDRAALRRNVNASFSPSAASLLRTWNHLFVQSRYNARPALGARSSGLRAHQILAERVDPLLRRVPRRWPSARDRSRLDELGARYAESNRRLQEFCPHSLADFGYHVQG